MVPPVLRAPMDEGFYYFKGKFSMSETPTLRSNVSLGEGAEFRNGETCEGVAYPILTPDGEVDPSRDFASIKVTRRYPLDGLLYAKNNGSQERVEITSGEGYLLRAKTSGYMSRIALRPGTVVTIEPGELFAWWQTAWDDTKEPLGFDMICTPPFDPQQYEYSNPDELIARNANERKFDEVQS